MLSFIYTTLLPKNKYLYEKRISSLILCKMRNNIYVFFFFKVRLG